MSFTFAEPSPSPSPTAASTAAATAAAALLTDISLEMTGKDVPSLLAAKDVIAAGTLVNITFLGNEDLQTRVAAAAAVREHGFRPVPHISARRLRSQAELQEFLGRLREVGATEQVFVVGGDPEEPAGPYADSLSVIETGLLPQYGVRAVTISGYPEGHPVISDDVLWNALERKAAALTAQGLDGAVITQFGFDVDPVRSWIRSVRDRGIDLPVRVGVPGPAGIRRLLGYARRFGVSSSAGIARKYGFSITNLLGTAGPDRFVTDLGEELTHAGLGVVRLHFYTFGGLLATSAWIDGFRAKKG